MKRRDKFPGFERCLAMMRKRDAQTSEDGFHWLLPRAAEHVPQLIEAFGQEQEHGLRCWLVELVGNAKAPEGLPFLKELLHDSDESIRDWAKVGLEALDSRESRKALFEAARSKRASSESPQR